MDYFEQITKLLDRHDLTQELKNRRKQLGKQLKAVEKKFEQLDENLSKNKLAVLEQATSLDLPVEVFHEVITSQGQVNFLMDSADKDDYLSSLSEAYQEELVVIETEIIALKSNLLSVAA